MSDEDGMTEEQSAIMNVGRASEPMPTRILIRAVAAVCVAAGVLFAAGCSTEPKPVAYTPAKIAADKAELKNMNEATLNNPNAPESVKDTIRAEMAHPPNMGPGGTLPAAGK